MASNKSRGSGVTQARSTSAQISAMAGAPVQVNPQGPQIPIQQAQPQQVVPTAQQAQQANNGQFSDHDDADFHDLYNGRGYFQKQQFGIDSEVARQNYLVASPEPTMYGGDGVHSPSQNMNWEMMNGLPMSPTHQATRDGLMDAMHNLGYNLNLQRYDHGSFVDRLLQHYGINGRTTNMTEAQLQRALVGKSRKNTGNGTCRKVRFWNSLTGKYRKTGRTGRLNGGVISGPVVSKRMMIQSSWWNGKRFARLRCGANYTDTRLMKRQSTRKPGRSIQSLQALRDGVARV